MSTAHWPPWVIIEGYEKSAHKTQSNNNQRFSGINIDIAKALAEKLGFNLILNSCSWSSCINLHKAGKSDILDSLLMRASRQRDICILLPLLIKRPLIKWSISSRRSDLFKSILMTICINWKKLVSLKPPNTHRNLIATISLTNTLWSSDMQLFAMLKRDRISAFIMDENIADYMLSHSQYAGLFKKSMRFNENRKRRLFCIIEEVCSR